MMMTGVRVRVRRGEHEGRTGTIGIVGSMPLARYLAIGPGSVQVRLDGEPARGAVGGRGGFAIVLPIEDLEPYAGPPGRALPKDKGHP